MHVGFSLPGRGPLARPDALAKLAERAEALHYSSDLTPQDLRGQIAMMERFAEDVRPAVRAGARPTSRRRGAQ